jgi:proteasome lid subunit RPN8/RPN11
LYDQLVEHAREDQPRECCGLIATKDGAAQRVYRVTNSYKYPNLGYEMGYDAARLMFEIEDAGWEVGALYHSHPRTAAIPSQTDINAAVPPATNEPLWPNTIYVIIGFPDAAEEPEVRGYRIDGDGVAEVALSVR